MPTIVGMKKCYNLRARFFRCHVLETLVLNVNIELTHLLSLWRVGDTDFLKCALSFRLVCRLMEL